MSKEPTKEKIPGYKEPVKSAVYARIFKKDKDGKAILAELNRLHYNRPSFVLGDDALSAAFKEGQRSIVALINRKTNREE